jgi:iron(III) transport system substrate-binding protein
MRHRRRGLIGILAVLAVLALAPSALAQGSRVAEIATYQGADREQRLIEGAKKEKELAFYSSVPPEDIAALISAFDKKYGVKVRVWRSDSEGILQRISSEAKARRFEVDIMAGSSSALEPLYRENLLQEVKSPYLADILPEAIAPHRQWVSIYLSTFVQAYNTNLVRQESLPKTYRDLLNPEWKGRIAIEAEDFDWFAQVVMDMGEARGLQLFRDIVRPTASRAQGPQPLTSLRCGGCPPPGLRLFVSGLAQRRAARLVRASGDCALDRGGLARNAPSSYRFVLFMISHQ